MTRKNVATTT